MSRFIKFTWLLMAIILLGLASCGGKATPTTDPSLAYTQIWETVAVAQTQTALAVSPTPSVTESPAVPLDTPTLMPTNTPLLTNGFFAVTLFATNGDAFYRLLAQ